MLEGQMEVFDGVSASMRPRRMRLGCPAERVGPNQGYAGFNEAEANAPRMPRRRASCALA